MEKLESWRRPHETPTEWRIRRSFLEKNFDKLQPERLQCLSHCYTNVKLYQVTYPTKVMEEINALGEDLGDIDTSGQSKQTNV